MGNKLCNLTSCFAGGDFFRRRNHNIAAVTSQPDDPTVNEGFGHSFSYILTPDNRQTTTTPPPPFRTISGAAISANTSTPLSTDPFASINSDKPSSFHSSNLFSSIPLQPIPAVRSGPILRNTVPGSGPIERGFLSGPIERSFTSGPLDHHRHKSIQRTKFIRKFKNRIKNSLWTLDKHLNGIHHSHSTVTNSELSLDENDDVSNPLLLPNLQWAHGKAGEDRVHVVVSEDHGWIFVGIYDGFNGPDATDYLLHNLYRNIYKELDGLLLSELWNRRNHLGVLKGLSDALKKTEALYLKTSNVVLKENPELAMMGSCVLVLVMKGDDVYLMNVGDSRGVLARSGEDCRPRKIGKENEYEFDRYEDVVDLCSYQLTMEHNTSIKEEVRRIRNAHPEDTLAVINDRVKGSLKVTRAFGVGFLKHPRWNNALLEMFRIDYIGTLPYITCSPSLCHHRLQPNDKFLILSSDGLYQYFTNEEVVFAVETFVSMFPEGDPAQHLVEEVLFRAANKAGLDFNELLAIPQGDRRRYHDDVSIIIISFEGRIWQSLV